MNKNEVLKEFLENNDVLIVDKNPSSRNRLLKIIYDLGAKRHMIHTASGMEEAEALLKNKKVGIVLSEYYILGGSGFDLFNLIRKQNTSQHLCLVLVTSNISETAVARAAEEDVDSFVIKPYTIQGIRENLASTIFHKVKPSDYFVKINEAKKLIEKQEFDSAIKLLNEAKKLHQEPALALFYIGQAEYLKRLLDEAVVSYNHGLEINEIHFKCLIGLYELLIQQENFTGAYEVVRKIARYFPANPNRLGEIIRLAIKTNNFEDMGLYYEIYTSLEERAEVLTNYIGAGLFVGGKYYLREAQRAKALAYFDNIAVSCSRFPKFIRAIITLLIENNMASEAERYLLRFPAGTMDSPDYLVSDFLILSRMSLNKAQIVKRGLELYNQKIKDPLTLRILLTTMQEINFNKTIIEAVQLDVDSLQSE